MKKKLYIGVTTAVAIIAVTWGGYSFAKFESLVPEWKAQPPVPYVNP
jgi:hypothetical protein